MNHRLLDHPFYRAWMEGSITALQLSDYQRSYGEFVREIPRLWQKVVDAFGYAVPEGKAIVEEERTHAELWDRWKRKLSGSSVPKGMRDVCEQLDRLSPSALLGALHAFEIQQPEVARTKKEGLVRWYGYTGEDLAYFDAHLEEERHIVYGNRLAHHAAVRSEFEEGFSRGAELIYRSLDRFLEA
jgi:pyrroloquinoline quinone (PQQ) biosynthesis protein C